MALPIFGAFKAHKPTPEWKKGPIDILFVGEYPNGRWVKDPFIEINLDNGPVTIHGITFSVSDLMPVRLTYGIKSTTSPTEESIEKLRNILRSNDGGTVDILWGPDTYPTWVKVYREEDDTAFLVPLSSGEFSRSKFINDCTKDDSGQAWRFYHIVYGKYNNFWSIGV